MTTPRGMALTSLDPRDHDSNLIDAQPTAGETAGRIASP